MVILSAYIAIVSVVRFDSDHFAFFNPGLDDTLMVATTIAGTGGIYDFLLLGRFHKISLFYILKIQKNISELDCRRLEFNDQPVLNQKIPLEGLYPSYFSDHKNATARLPMM